MRTSLGINPRQEYRVTQTRGPASSTIHRLQIQLRKRIGQRFGRCARHWSMSGIRPEPDRLLDRIGIQKRDRRVTISALRVVFQVHGRAALRTANLPYGRAHTLQFGECQVANELLLPQELKEGGESAVALRTAVVREPAGLAKVMAESQRIWAPRADQSAADGATGVIPMCVNLPEKPDYRDRRELRTFEMVEPDTRATKAQVQLQCPMVVALKHFRLHRLPAVRALQSRRRCRARAIAMPEFIRVHTSIPRVAPDLVAD